MPKSHVLLAFDVDDDVRDLNKARGELKLSIPAVFASPFVYSMLADMAIPANWLLTPAKTGLLSIDTQTLTDWQAKVAQVRQQAAGR